jgi:hypothetical protein
MSSGAKAQAIRTSQMSSSSLPPLHLEFPRPPARGVLSALALTITIVAPALAVVSYGSAAAALAGIAGLTLSAYVQWRNGWLGSTYHIRSAAWDSEGQWWLTLSGPACIAADLCPESVVQRSGAWLIFKTEEGRKVFLLVTARMFPSAYRRLLVRLRTVGAARRSISKPAELSDVSHVHAYLPLLVANFRLARRSTRALMQLLWPRATPGETRRP